MSHSQYWQLWKMVLEQAGPEQGNRRAGSRRETRRGEAAYLVVSAVGRGWFTCSPPTEESFEKYLCCRRNKKQLFEVLHSFVFVSVVFFCKISIRDSVQMTPFVQHPWKGAGEREMTLPPLGRAPEGGRGAFPAHDSALRRCENVSPVQSSF